MIRIIKSLYFVLIIIGVVAVSGIMLAFLSCQPESGSAAAQVPGNICPVIVEKGGEDSDMVIESDVKRALPLIDTRIPADLETATFALG